MRWLALLLLLVVCSSASAADRDVPPPPSAATAQPLAPITAKQWRWLKPGRGRLPPNPYQSVDFTAYTLEWGEVKIGLTSVALGLLPRVQVGTVPVLDLLGLYNGSAKIDLVRIGPLDVAGLGVAHQLTLGDFQAVYAGAGGMLSLRILPAWSIHGGVRYNRLEAHGVPDLSRLSPLLTDLTGARLDGLSLPTDGLKADPRIQGEAWLIDAATDFRINRRDALVFRVQFVAHASAEGDLGFEPPPILGIDQTFAYDAKIPFDSSYLASVSYQVSWRHLQVRGGMGASAVPLAWLIQATDLSWRMGGRTRRTEARTKRGWRHNRDDVGDGDPVDVDAPTP